MATRHLPPFALCLVLSLALAAGCRPAPPREAPSSPNASLEIVEMLRADLAAERHPSDGGGRAWIVEGPERPTAGSWGRWQLAFEAGPLGVSEGGQVFLQISPFWGWSTPQTVAPDFQGFTRVSTAAPGVELEIENLGQQLLSVRIQGRDLRAGERLDFVYGAGQGLARADNYAESGSRFWFAVDGDGDGVRGLVENSPRTAISAGVPARLVATLPSVARVGETVRLTLAVLDAYANAGTSFAGPLELTTGDGLQVPSRVALEPEDRGAVTIPVRALEEGIYRIRVEAPELAPATSNPLEISGVAQRILWADVHGHSALSDGTGTPADYLGYARDVAALDVVALTDHDHWGLRPLSRHPELWGEIRRQTENFHQPGRFVTLLGYEWTNWIHGHRHVLYFGSEGEILSSIDPAYEHPNQLWAALRGLPALTFAHHSAGAPVATNWTIPPDPDLEPVTEITSVHGSSEALDAPRPVAGAIPGNFVRDALDRGYRLGLIGSGDSHDGHPGLAHLAAGNGGLAALVGAERTRGSVRETLRARRVYATNGPRILLEASFDGRPMGSLLRAQEGGELTVRAIGTAPILQVDLIRSGVLLETHPADGTEARVIRRLGSLQPGEYLYVRVVQSDGGAAWSSPFFFE